MVDLINCLHLYFDLLTPMESTKLQLYQLFVILNGLMLEAGQRAMEDKL